MNNWLDLDGKVALVTGGASGIGKEIALNLSQNGMKVAVGDLSFTNISDDDFGGDSFHLIECDVTNLDSVKNMITQTIERFGKIDVLVNNAGINMPRLLVDVKGEHPEYELDERSFDKMYLVNQKGAFFCAQAAAKEMLKNSSGVIINVTSECGLEGSEGQSAYAATKAAVYSFTRSWAKELGRSGIRVVGIAPGIIEATGLRTLEYEKALAYTRNISVEQLRSGYESTSTTPLGRAGKLSEIADAVAFLSSDRAGYIHGVTYNVAGGKTRG
jgi:sorbitol-6-phosphate 2-dehydrogenase